MAEAVWQAISQGQHLIVEAGTGVGKSFAYLVPAILRATEPVADEGRDESQQDKKERAKRVIISTHTISLQEQLMGKDLPFLNSVIPREFSAVLVKGRRNYFSLRRLGNAVARSGSLFQEPRQLDWLRDLQGWAGQTTEGSLSDLTARPPSEVWDEVASDSGNCMRRNCATYAQCFYFKARRRVQHAQLLVVNHALFFSDLALRKVGVNILPDYDTVIFDEAHTMESVAAEHLGLRITSGQIEYQLNKLYNDRSNKGLLVHNKLAEPQQQVLSCRYAAADFFDEIRTWLLDQGSSNGRVRQPEIVSNALSPALTELGRMVREGSSRGEK